MAAKAIREAKGKQLLSQFLTANVAPVQSATVTSNTSWDQLVAANQWLTTQKLVVKPDQMIKRRGKLGLIKVNVDLPEVKKWIAERMDKEIQVNLRFLRTWLNFLVAFFIFNYFFKLKIGKSSGKLNNFLIEPFIAHQQSDEYYVCIYSHREGETVLFHHEGGVDIGDVDAKALKLSVPIDEQLKLTYISSKLLVNVANQKRKEMLTQFIFNLYEVYMDLHFTYLEINPLVCTDSSVYILDLASKIDQTADYLCKIKWGDIDFPPPFGRDAYPEEAYIADLDSKSGASLKLTILNPKGRIWTMVAGGGASVIYSDTICDLGGSTELANYGEYSGAPSEQQTYEYAKTIFSSMTKEKHPDGKVLLIGGGIANFTNVAATFKGIVKAINEFHQKIVDHNISIYVRRAGPNYQEGLRVMREVGQSLNIPIHVFGPETHMTAIVGMALNKREIPKPSKPSVTTASFLLPSTADYSSETSSRSNSLTGNSLQVSSSNSDSGNKIGN
jgi:ATP citrate (pro-S)-lyase